MNNTVNNAAWYVLTYTDSEGKKHMTEMRIPNTSNLAAICGYDTINHCSSKTEADKIIEAFINEQNS